MKTLTNLLLATTIILGACTQVSTGNDDNGGKTDPQLNPKSRIDLGQTVKSSILGKEVRYTIYLPAGYDDSRKEYPVLYLLHGYDFNGGNEKGDLAWVSSGSMVQSTDSAIKDGKVGELVVVMPCGFNAFYVNGFQDGMKYEDFFFDELIPHIEANYKVRPGRASRAIAGLSMGGYGTTLYAFKHPEMFCMAYSMSGAVAGNGNVTTPQSVIESSMANGAKSDGFPYYIMEVGIQDQIPGLYKANVDFDKYLTSKNIAHEYLEREGGHDWAFWTECYKKCLVALGNYYTANNKQ